MKTGKQIQGDVYRMLRTSNLATIISGNVYREGMRPKDSELEDAIVIFTGGIDDDIQEGIVTINIYVPDTDPYDNEVLTINGERCEQLEIASNNWVESLSASCSDYLFEKSQTITTDEAPEINQHFVVIKLKYKLLTD